MKEKSAMRISQFLTVTEIREKPKISRKPTEEELNEIRIIIFRRLLPYGAGELRRKFNSGLISEEEYDKEYQELFENNLHLFLDIFG